MDIFVRKMTFLQYNSIYCGFVTNPWTCIRNIISCWYWWQMIGQMQSLLTNKEIFSYMTSTGSWLPTIYRQFPSPHPFESFNFIRHLQFASQCTSHYNSQYKVKVKVLTTTCAGSDESAKTLWQTSDNRSLRITTCCSLVRNGTQFMLTDSSNDDIRTK